MVSVSPIPLVPVQTSTEPTDGLSDHQCGRCAPLGPTRLIRGDLRAVFQTRSHEVRPFGEGQPTAGDQNSRSHATGRLLRPYRNGIARSDVETVAGAAGGLREMRRGKLDAVARPEFQRDPAALFVWLSHPLFGDSDTFLLVEHALRNEFAHRAAAPPYGFAPREQ